MLTIAPLCSRPIPADELELLPAPNEQEAATTPHAAEPPFVVGCWALTMADELAMADEESDICFGTAGRLEVRIGSDRLTADYCYRGRCFSISGISHTPESLSPAMSMLLETLTSEHHVEVQSPDSIDIHGRHLLLLTRK